MQTMPAEAEARVLALLSMLSENKLTDEQAARLYNDLSARLVRIPAQYQVAFAMQIIEESGHALSIEAAERIAVLVIYCVCYPAEDGKAGYETVTLAAIEQYRAVFRPFFDHRDAALEELLTALSAAGQPLKL